MSALVLAGVYLGMIWLTTQVQSVRSASPWQNDPYDAVASLAPQVVLVVAALVAIRLLRYRSEPAPIGVLRYQVRGAAVLVGLASVTVVVDAIAWVSGAAADPTGRLAWVSRASVVVVGVVLVPVIVIVLRAARALGADENWGGRSAEPLPDGIADAAALVDRFLSGLLHTAPRIGEALEREWSRLRRAGARLHSLSVRAHPWRAAVASGLVAGSALAVAHDLGEGMPTGGVGDVILLWAVFVGVETIAILAAFAALGRFLGIVGRPAAPSPSGGAAEGDEL